MTNDVSDMLREVKSGNPFFLQKAREIEKKCVSLHAETITN